MRNSLDAMENKGKITIELGEDTENIFIDISDTGHGIPGQKFKSIFRPGYSTKKRGWGLGLSLAKRIIEEYHKGKIFVKSSKPFEKTTFSIKLNKIALA
ncbi:MAG: ATP-binding protein [Saprospiraceae bacterium]|nr:ATP-binding protein [Saprospiraceae bacterium]